MKEIRLASLFKMQLHSGFQHIPNLDTMQTAAFHACKTSSRLMNKEQQDISIQIIVESLQMRVSICVSGTISLLLIDHSPMESLNEQFKE